MDLQTHESICLTFPGATRDIKWENDLCFLVGEKMFSVQGLNPPPRVSFKATPDDFAELTTRPGIIPAPYLARYHWVLVEDLHVLNRTEWEEYLRQSYRLVYEKLPKKIKNSISTESES